VGKKARHDREGQQILDGDVVGSRILDKCRDAVASHTDQQEGQKCVSLPSRQPQQRQEEDEENGNIKEGFQRATKPQADELRPCPAQLLPSAKQQLATQKSHDGSRQRHQLQKHDRENSPAEPEYSAVYFLSFARGENGRCAQQDQNLQDGICPQAGSRTPAKECGSDQGRPEDIFPEISLQ